jgi:hypothetical protein
MPSRTGTRVYIRLSNDVVEILACEGIISMTPRHLLHDIQPALPQIEEYRQKREIYLSISLTDPDGLPVESEGAGLSVWDVLASSCRLDDLPKGSPIRKQVDKALSDRLWGIIQRAKGLEWDGSLHEEEGEGEEEEEILGEDLKCD